MLQAPKLSPCHVSPWFGLEGEVLGLGLGLEGKVLGLGLGLAGQVLGLGLEAQVLGLGLGLAGQVLVNITENYRLLQEIQPEIGGALSCQHRQRMLTFLLYLTSPHDNHGFHLTYLRNRAIRKKAETGRGTSALSF